MAGYLTLDQLGSFNLLHNDVIYYIGKQHSEGTIRRKKLPFIHSAINTSLGMD